MIDGKALDGEWLGVEVMNIPFTGPGLHLAPKADFSDGMLELVCFEKKQADELGAWFNAPAESAPPALTRRGKLITLTWKDAPHRVDDESFKAEDATKVVTIQCEEQPALILETRLKPEPTSRGAAGGRAMNKHVELPISVDELHEIESLAVEIANLAGAEIKSALGGIFTVRYKTGATDSKLWKDPVSEVDRKVEKLIRERLAEHFPSHDIIGEESKERPRPDSDFIWAVDPIDGTTNFINGFPMFAASIGVLYRCKPIVGAVWCATSHALRAGVYHARLGGKLRFEGSDVTPKANPDVRSRLAGVPVAKAEDLPWETRKTGAAAIECALVAAGLLQVARFSNPNIWDVAGGLALVQAAGGVVWEKRKDGWQPMERFNPGKNPEDESSDLRYWRSSIVIGAPDAVKRMCAPPPVAPIVAAPATA